MDTLLKNMDFSADDSGHPITITGLHALIQRCLIRLSVRKGSFLPNPGLGSRLHTLPTSLAGQHRDSLALHYAREALLPEKAAVTHAACRPLKNRPDRLAISLSIKLDNRSVPLEVTV